MRCACDACVRVSEDRRPGETWTPDGYCHFCDRFCFPSFSQPGEPPSRLKGTREARLQIHGQAPAATAVIETPDDGPARPSLLRRLANIGLGAIPNPAARLGAQIGMSVLDELAPYISPAAGKLANSVAKKLPKLGKPKKRRKR